MATVGEESAVKDDTLEEKRKKKIKVQSEEAMTK